MKKVKEKLKTAMRRAACITLAAATCLTGFSSFGTLTARADVEQSVRNVATIMPDGTQVTGGELLNISMETYASIDDNTGGQIGSVAIGTGTSLYLPFEEKTYTDPCTLHFKNVGARNGRALDVDIEVTEITVHDITPQEERPTDEYAGENTVEFWYDKVKFATVKENGFNFEADVDKVDVSYVLQIKYQDTGEIVSCPCWQEIIDIDQVYTRLDFKESWEGDAQYFKEYFVWDQCTLVAEKDGDRVRFSDRAAGGTEGDDMYYKTGLIAMAYGGEFAGAFYVRSCGMELRVMIDEEGDPIKTVTTTGHTSEGVSGEYYLTGDTVGYSVTQKMGAFYHDTFAYYMRLSLSDEIPAGLTLAAGSEKMTSGGTDITDTAGSFSYKDRVLTYTFDEDWLYDKDNYAGQDLEMTFSCTVDEVWEDDNITNIAQVDLDEESLYTNEAVIDVRIPVISIAKSASVTTVNPRDSFEYTITVKETLADAVDRDLVITDTIPEGLAISDDVTSTKGCVDVNGNCLSLTLDTLRYGDAATITVPVTVDDALAGETVKNTSCVSDRYGNAEQSVATVRVLQPALSVSKKAAQTVGSVSDTVTYTIAVDQTEPGAIARNTVLTDTLPDELALRDVRTDTGTVCVDGNGFAVELGDVSAETATVTVTAEALTVGEDIVNTAYAAADYTVEASDDAKVVIRRPTLDIRKSADAETYYAGDTVTYTIDVINLKESECETGSVPTAYNVLVRDTVPEELTLLDVTAPEGEIAVDGNSFTVSYPSMYYGDVNTITVTATALDVGNVTVTNVASVSSDTTEERDDYAEVSIIKPILSIGKTVDRETHSVGEDVVYTIDVCQTVAGLTAYNVEITDTLPDEMELADVVLEGVEGEVVTEDNGLTVRIPALDFGETAHITVTAEAVAPLEGVTNTACVTADHADPEESAVTHDILQPDLAIEKTADAGSYNVGDTVTYTIRASQTTENAVAYHVVVTDLLPEELLLQDIALSGVEGEIAYTEDGFTVTYEQLDETDAIITVTALVTEDAGDKTLTNTATVTADKAEMTVADAEIFAMQPALRIEKTADEETYFVGDTASYRITVSQTTENATAYDVVVTDTLPDGLALMDVSCADGAIEVEGNAFVVTFDTVSDRETIFVTAKVLEESANGSVTNVATGSASNAEEVSDGEDIYVMQPALSIEKSARKDTYSVNDTAEFTVTIAQTVEGAVEENVVMTDVLPDGLSVSGTPTLEGVEGDVTVDGAIVTVSIPALAYGESAVIGINAAVGDSLAGESVTNTAYVNGDHTGDQYDDATIRVRKAETSAVSGPKTGQGTTGILLVILCGLASGTIVFALRRRRGIR